VQSIIGSHGFMGNISRLRIAQITFACHRRGGIERVVYELSKRFARDHEVHIFAGTCELESEGVTFHKLSVIPWPWVVNHLSYFLMTRLALRREQARRPFDIVHVQGIPAAIYSDFTTAHSVHSVGTDHQKKIMPLRKKISRYIKSGEPVIMWLTGYNFQPGRCRHIIAISEQVKRDVVATFGMPSENIEVIHNGVDVELFSPARCHKVRSTMRSKLDLSPEATVAVFVANEFQRKGLDKLLKSLARIDHLQRPYLIVVGDTRDSILTLSDCKQLVTELGINPWVRFVGAVENVEDFFATADFFVLPTIYEAFGLVILEALASGLPAVFSRLAGASDIVEDGREALLIQNPRDQDEIAAKMLTLIRNPALRMRMGKAARETALKYSWDIIAERTLTLYRNFLSQCSVWL